MQLWQYALLFFSVLLGGGLALYLRRNYPRQLKLILAFSGAYILGIAVLHLMPAVFTEEAGTIGIWVLAGFFFQLMLEQLSRGVEHGHFHIHPEGRTSFGLQIMLGLCLHSFLEGMPLSGYTALHHGEGVENNHLLYGIVLHKAPAAFALVVLLLQSRFSRWFVLGSLLFFSAMSPLGAFVTAYLNPGMAATRILMALVIGSFLHISTTILFEADDNRQHTISWTKLTIILAGLSLALLTI